MTISPATPGVNVGVQGSGTTFNITGLQHDTTYEVQVRANNSVGHSPWSQSTSFHTKNLLPGAPGKPTVVADITTAVVSWSAPGHYGATPIFDYNVQIRPTGGTWVGSTPFHWGTHTNHTLTDLTPGTEYQVRVYAKNHGLGGSETGYGPTSPVTTFRTNLDRTMPEDWSFTPEGLVSGDEFRLLFVTFGTRDAQSSNIAHYDNLVHQAIAGSGHDDIRQYSDAFHALASTHNKVDALTNTDTHYTSDDPGVPIYWLGGAGVAADYADFYDGCWESNEPRDQKGDIRNGWRVWTGSESDGTADPHALGSGRSVVFGTPSQACLEISNRTPDSDGFTLGGAGNHYHLYGLSKVFTVE